MYNRSWAELTKSNSGYKYEPKINVGKEQRTAKLGLTQLAFDHDEEYVIATDTKGDLHCIELSEGNTPCCKQLGRVGQATCLAFNPMCKGEILIGLDIGDIKIWKLHTDIDEFSLLSGHKLPLIYISFYKNHCLTCSRNEVIIWHLRSYNKVHQLKINAKYAVIRKAIFSDAGHIVVLYRNDTMQIWMFRQLNKDTKINAKVFGMRYIRDFVFTKDGKAMIMTGTESVSIFSTYDWSLLKKLCLPKNFVKMKQLSIIPRPLDGGANKIIALLSSKCTLHFCDMNALSFLEIPNINRIKKFVVSSTGRYLAYIDQEECLNIIHIDKLFVRKYLQPKKSVEPHRLQAHKRSDHLECIRQTIRQELDIKRLISILKEFGEYPEKYRAIIWSTILKLPANKNAYLALMSEVTRGGFTSNILRNHPLADRSKASLLAMMMDCLLQWCPLFIHSQFLPNLIFPFLVVFQKDPLLAFELILSILLNYCQSWFEYHPLPPLNILGIIENVLLEADPELLNSFCEHGITTNEYAWPLLRTTMSEVLSGDEWLILWDHLITFQKPTLLLMCVVAYNIYSRKNIISLIKSSGDIKAFYSTQGHVRAKDILKIARKLNQHIPERVHPDRYLRNELLQLNHFGPYSLFILKEFPKFVTEHFCTMDLEKCKMEKHLLKHNHKIAKLAEEKRLHSETEAFVKQIHETRLDEVQKCFQEHVSSLDRNMENVLLNAIRRSCQHLYKDSNDLRLEQTQTCNKCKSTEDEISSSKKMETKDYGKLRRDITMLENEVQSFLDSIRSERSKVDVT